MQCGPLAQLVEQGTLNPKVVGSTPTRPTNLFRHWAHLRKRNCDTWWENETEWHRNWKNRFPSDWQEIICKAENGEKHIADVKTAQGWVLEFQHSYLNPEERKARDDFYDQLVWIVDGTRRKRDKKQFLEALEKATCISSNPSPQILRISVDECKVLKEWSDCRAPVIFDFGEADQPELTKLMLFNSNRGGLDGIYHRFFSRGPRNSIS